MPIHRRRSRPDPETNDRRSLEAVESPATSATEGMPDAAAEAAEARRLLAAWRSLATADRALLLTMAEVMASQRQAPDR